MDEPHKPAPRTGSFLPEDTTADAEFERASKKESHIRTMKSDVASYIKSEKPSLMSMMGKGGKDEPLDIKEKRRPQFLKYVSVAIMIALFGMFGFLGYLLYQSGNGSGGATTAGVKFFKADKVAKISTRQNKTELLKAIKNEATEYEREGLMKELQISFGNTVAAQNISLQQFFSTLDISTPPGLLQDLGPEFMPYILHAKGAGRIGIIVRTKNPEKTKAKIYSEWEGSIQKDLNPLFVGEPLDVTIPLFEDKEFRNIPYRYVELSSKKDFGVGYAVYDARSLLIIATSEEELKIVISRLLES